jgi:hydrogenase maturation protease
MNSGRAQIIGIGQDTAGDDGVGLAVTRWIVAQGLSEGISVIEQAEPSALITQFHSGAECVILVDAIVDGGESGRVVQIDPGGAGVVESQLFSTHGIGLLDAIALAGMLDKNAMPRRIAIVGVTIAPPTRHRPVLSEAVAAAIPRAAQLALDLARA